MTIPEVQERLREMGMNYSKSQESEYHKLSFMELKALEDKASTWLKENLGHHKYNEAQSRYKLLVQALNDRNPF